MTWLGQNWLWIALAIGAFFYLTRMRGFGMGGSRRYGGYDDRRNIAPPPAGNRPTSLFDAVSGHGFVADSAPISTVYHGRAYYFENRQNRDAFETDPEKYLTGRQGLGEPVGAGAGYEQQRPHRHHGC